MTLTASMCLLLARVTLSQLVGSNVYDHVSWEGKLPLGFEITKVERHPGGLDVRFRTDLPPPYVAAAYIGVSSGFSHCPYPIACTTTETFCAFVETDVHDYVTTYLMVGTPEGIGATEVCSQEYVDSYISSAMNGKGFGLLDGMSVSEYERSDNAMKLVSDGTWSMFVASKHPGEEFRISGIDSPGTLPNWQWKTDSVQTYAEMGYSYWEKKSTGEKSDEYRWTNKVYSSTYPAGKSVYRNFRSTKDVDTGEYIFVNTLADMTLGDVHNYTHPENVPVSGSYDWLRFPTNESAYAVGTGWRVVFFEDDESVLLSRAYGCGTNVSNKAFVLPRVRSLSRKENRVYGIDWLGTRRFYEETNSVPGRIYWEGIRR